MAIDTAYATAAEYRARTTKADIGDDDTIDIQLAAVSRMFENRTGQFFNQDASVVARYYPTEKGGGARLDVDPIATATGLIVAWDDDGDFSYGQALAINTDFVLAPYNAALQPEANPWTYLELNPNSALLTSWPTSPRSIKVTAKFGWPAVPAAIKEATITVTRMLRDLQESGYTLTLENLDAGQPYGREIAMIVNRIEAQYKVFGGL